MSDHWNIQLLNQHAAILKSALKTVNTVARSTGEEAEEPADSINQGYIKAQDLVRTLEEAGILL